MKPIHPVVIYFWGSALHAASENNFLHIHFELSHPAESKLIWLLNESILQQMSDAHHFLKTKKLILYFSGL